MIRCLITDGTASANESRWLEHKAAWLAEGIELMQIRERDLSARQLADLTRAVLRLPNPHGTKILINDRADIALACGADGVHLRDGSVWPEFFAHLRSSSQFLVSVACHSVVDAGKTRAADYIILAPVFKPLSKTDSRPALGVSAITQLTAVTQTPVLALGGITTENARLCMEGGAAGVAGISYFNGLPSVADRPSAPLSVLP